MRFALLLRIPYLPSNYHAYKRTSTAILQLKFNCQGSIPVNCEDLGIFRLHAFGSRGLSLYPCDSSFNKQNRHKTFRLEIRNKRKEYRENGSRMIMRRKSSVVVLLC